MPSVIRSVRLQNFGPFKDSTVTLDAPGITVLEGRIQNAHGCNSNGSGKSSVVHAICYALFGKTLVQGYTGDAVVRRGSTRGCRVCAVVERDGDTIEVIRYRKHPKHRNKVFLHVNGLDETGGTTKKTDELIVQCTGLTFQDMASSIAFGAREEVRGFFTATDSERKKLFDSLLGLDGFAAAESRAKELRNTASNELRTLDHDLDKLNSDIDSKAEYAGQLRAMEDEQEEELDESRLIGAQLVILRPQLDAAKRHVDSCQQRYDEAAAEHRRRVEAHNQRVERKREKVHELDSQIRDLQNEIRAQDSQREDRRKVYKRVENLEGSCPTCRRAVDGQSQQRVLSELAAEIQSFQDELLRLDVEKSRLEEERESLRIPVAPESPEMDLVAQELQWAEEWRNELASKITTLESQRKTAERMNERSSRAQITETRQRIEREIESLSDTRDERQAERDEKRKQHEIYDFWVRGFGHRGLRSYLIEAVLPRINRRVTEYASRLLGSGTHVELSATQQLKSREETVEKIGVHLDIPGRAQSYEAASKGQRTRLDLALLLAIRDTVSQRSQNSYNQLIIDELFDGLDESGVEVACEILSEISQGCPVLLITHSPDLKGMVADRAMTVVHDGESAFIGCEN